MDDWWTEAFQPDATLTVGGLTVRLVAAFVLGLVVAAIHRCTARRDDSEAVNLSATLVLLSILIATVTQVIGNSVARAFSLVGALAIIRFRTVVEDTRDTAFVIFAVVIGMATGAGHFPIAVVGLAVGGVAAFFMAGLTTPGAAAFFRKWLRLAAPVPPPAPGDVFTLTVRVGLRPGQDDLFARVFETFLESSTLQSTSTARQGAALELTWQVRLRPGLSPLALVGELNQLEGVQGVELKRR